MEGGVMDDNRREQLRQIAIAAQTGHFAPHVFGSQDHVEVLAQMLEEAVEAIPDEEDDDE